MVQKDHSQKIPGEPPQLGDAWWKAALSEGDDGFIGAEFQEECQLSSEPHIQTQVDLSQPENDWNYINELYQQDEILQLKVVGCNQGGLLVQGDKITGFVPSSHLLAGYKKKEYLQQMVSLKIIEYDRDRCRVVMSERAAQAEPGTRLKLLDALEEGTCIPGIVTTLTDFGAFLDLGGMEGLIHISELSWGRVDHPSDVVAVGERYQQGQIVEAVVKNIVSYGAFVQLEEGVDGLIHVSELGGNGDQVSPWDVLEENQKIAVEIIYLDPEEQRLGLSLEVGK